MTGMASTVAAGPADAWQLLTPQGEVLATAATPMQAWSRLDRSGKVTLAGLMRWERDGWHVEPTSAGGRLCTKCGAIAAEDALAGGIAP